MFSLEFWLIIAVLFILGELLTGTLFLLAVGIGSAFAGLANYLNLDPITQLIVFAIVTILMVILSKPIASKLTKNSPAKKANADRLIGEKVKVIEEIKKDEMGLVNYLGDNWKATSKDNIPANERAIVESINGVTLTVKKIKE